MASTPVNHRIEGLDLLRGLAIALVLVRHAWPEAVGTGGVVGVVMFFALSGYLITGLLLRDINRFGRVRYGRFYRNRAIRLLPALVVMLLGVVVVTLVWDPLSEKGGLLRTVVIGLTYTGNLPIDLGSRTIGHLWTLATEEQFYLVWPLILALGIRWKRTGLLLVLSMAAIVAIFAVSLVWAEPAVERVYTLPTSWAPAMVIGAAARIYEGRISTLLPKAGAGRAVLSLVMVAGLLAVTALHEAKTSPVTYLVVGPAIAAMTVVLIFHVREWRTVPFAWLRPVVALGTISYAAYLWNYPIVMYLGERPLDPVRAVGSIVLTLIAASLSWWLVEKPFTVVKARLDARATARAELTGPAPVE